MRQEPPPSRPRAKRPMAYASVEAERPKQRRRIPLVFGLAGVAIFVILIGLRAFHVGSGGCPLYGVDIGGPAWSPNGREIAFVRRDPSGFHIYALDLATRRVSQLTH